jgi:hypothetical protein
VPEGSRSPQSDRGKSHPDLQKRTRNQLRLNRLNISELHAAGNPFRPLRVVFTYNRPQCCTGDCRMQEQGHQRFGEHGWRGTLALFAICVLTLSFATRFGTDPDTFGALGNSHIQAEKSADHRFVEPDRQHFDRDATEWASPSATVSLVNFTAFEAPPVSAGTLLPTHTFAGQLYVRPPPSAQILF